MRVIATAGHVDHGKSTLVRALTGINPDRLREEQRREMTIDLGFAWLNLPGSGEPVGIIDVPGHIDFIDNMLAGIGGIDLALLVIAADEGAMPQTREHLAILELLRAERAVVALTKSDLVDDEWLTLMQAEVATLLSATRLRGAPIIPLSARAGHGLEALLKTVAQALAEAPVRRDLGKPRLSADRVFTQTGFGTVVTGTLIDGTLAVGDAVEIVTQRGARLDSHVRGLQTHKQKLERALPGSRVAINLASVAVEDVARGSVVTLPGTLAPSTLLDVQIDMLAEGALLGGPASRVALEHGATVKVFSGAAMSVAQVWLLDSAVLKPGESGWAQLQLVTPMAMVSADRMILRLPSPSVTLGGATVIDAHPERRYRRRAGKADDAVLVRLDALSRGTPAERLLSALARLGLCAHADAQQQAQLTPEQMDAALRETLAAGQVSESTGILALETVWREQVAAAETVLAPFHHKAPLSLGMSKESLRSQLKLTPRQLEALLQHPQGQDKLAVEGDVARLATHAVKFTPQQQRLVDKLLADCAVQPWNTPLIKDAKAMLGDPVFLVLVQRRQLVILNDDVFLLAQTYDAAVNSVREFISRERQITAAQARDLFGTTRKYALALLEQFDAIGITKRVGDARVLR
jgi:selenocysteine-specific elongation factor